MLHCVIRCVSFVVCLSSWARPAVAEQPAAPQDPIAALAAMPPHPPVLNGARFVVHDEHGKPAPTAIVVFVPQRDDGPALPQVAGDEPATLAAQAAHGTRYQVDQRGATRVPAKPGFVLAQRGERFGSLGVDARLAGTQRTLPLAPCRSFGVTTTHADGKPAAHVPIGVRGGGDTEWFAGAVTDANGQARVRVIDQHGASPRVGARIPTRQGVLVPLPDGSADAQLVLPEVAAVDAELDGAALPGADAHWVLRGGIDMTATEASRSDAASAHFPFVEVGIAVRVELLVDGIEAGVQSLDRVRGDAPNRIRVRRAMPERCVVVRVLEPDGRVPQRQAVSVRWNHKGGSAVTWARTTRQGWLEIAVPDAVEEATLQLGLHTAGFDSSMPFLLRLPLQRLSKGCTELGEHRSQALPVALQATVRDVDGKPVAGVRLSLPDQGGRYITTDAEGRCVVHLPAPLPDHLELGIDPQWYFAGDERDQLLTNTGDQPVNIVVQRAATLRFATKGLPPSPVGVGMATSTWPFRTVLEPANGTGAKVEIHLQPQAKSLRVPAGRWHFIVLHDDHEVHRIEDVVANAGVETHDPRFMDFDWHAFADLVTVRVQDALGLATDAARVLQESPQSKHYSGLRNGVAQLLVAKGAALRVEPDDKALPPIDLGVVTTEQVVRLGAGPRLLAKLTQVPTLPDDVELVLHAGDADAGETFDAEGTAELWLPAGTRACTPRLALRKGARRLFLPNDFPARDVPAGGGELSIDGGPALQRAIAAALPKL